MGCFRVEVQLTPDFQNIQFELEFELLFSELLASQILSYGPFALQQWNEVMNSIDEIEPLTSVSSKKLFLNNAAKGMSQMAQLIFTDQFFSAIQISVHTSLLNFKWSTIPNQSFLYTEEPLQLRKTPSKGEQRAPLPVPPKPQTFQDFLLRRLRQLATPEEPLITKRSILVVYNQYANLLIECYNRLQKKYNLYYSTCMTDKLKRECDMQPMAPQLVFLSQKPQSVKKYSLEDVKTKRKNENLKRQLFIRKGSLQYQHPLENEEVKHDSNPSTYRSYESSTSEKANAMSVPNTPQKHKYKKNEQKPQEIVSFVARLSNYKLSSIAVQMMKDFNLISGQIFMMWHKLLQLLTLSPRFILEHLQESYEKKVRDKWGENIFRDVQTTQDFAIPKEPNLGKMHELIAQKRRDFDLQEFGLHSVLPIEDPTLFPCGDKQPIIFEEIYFKTENEKRQSSIPINNFELSQHIDHLQQSKKDYKGVHLFVLVHGFQGRPTDMRLFRDNIALHHPESLFICSTVNQQNTENDIEDMGQMLAMEITEFIKDNSLNIGRLSFIGHSLGGIIIRASLKYLVAFKDKMHLYISLSSPHLGYMYNSNRIIDAGMWVLKKWSKSKCLQQLSMADKPQYKDTFLYRLSQQRCLQHFKHVILVSSFQDFYAPFDSARIQICNKAARDPIRGNMYIEMARNILSGLKSDILYRIDVNFKISSKNLDSLIGRTAHIYFLECQPLMKMIIFKYPEFFS